MPNPKQPPKVFDGYIRVSVVGGRSGERFQSPTAQREAIERHAAYKGWTIGEMHEDLDRSGGTLQRPGLQAILARIENGETGGLIAAKLDRISRSVQDGIAVIERIEQAGGEVVSIADDLDTSSANGKLLMHLMLSIGQWYRDVSKEQWVGSQERAVARGALPGRTPYGVDRQENGTVKLNRERAAIVGRMVRERAAGAGWKAIATGLTREGVPTPSGNGTWSASTVQGIVSSQAAVGIWTGPHEGRVEAAWPEMVDRATWDAAQLVKGKRTDGRLHQDRLIAGNARCAGCRRVLKRETNQTGQVSYGCNNRECPARTSISVALLDSYMSELIDGRLAHRSMTADLATDDIYAGLIAARDAASAATGRHLDDVELEATIGAARYRARLVALSGAEDAANAALAEHRRTLSPGLVGVPDDAPLSLSVLPWGRRVQLADAFLHAVFVRRPVRRGPQAAQDVAYRTHVQWADDPEHQLAQLPSPVSGPLTPIIW